jgi:RNA polymerase-binding transcription factor DksA
LEDSRESYKKLVEEHKQKLDEYKSNPYAHDNKNVLKNAPAQHHKDIIAGRIKVLENQLRKQEGELGKIEKALRDLNKGTGK